MKTTASSGSIRSPGFGEKFDARKFKNRVRYEYEFFLPPNMSTLSMIYPDLYLVVELQVDVQFYEGEEYVWLYFENLSYDLDVFYPGNISISRRFKAEQMEDGEIMYIDFERGVNEKSVDKQLEKRRGDFLLSGILMMVMARQLILNFMKKTILK